MKRYEHWLPPAKPSPWPGAMLCVSTDVSWHPHTSETGREYIRLEQWHATLCVRQGDGYAVSRSATGSDSESFWRTLRTATLRCSNLWVLCADTRQSAAALGLWDRMESGHVRIDGSDARGPRKRDNALPTVRRDGRRNVGAPPTVMGAGDVPRMSARMDARQGPSSVGHAAARDSVSGLCVLQDPPIIMQLRIDGGGGRITWVDAANYGIDPSGVDKGETVGAGALAEWFISAASTLHTLGRCGWCHTAGSQAMHLFRSVYHRTPILSHTERHATALERDGLFGGRCEVYQYGRIAGPVHLYDIRAMYPYLCANNPVPTALQYVLRGITPAALLDRLGPSTTAIARVDIETEEPDYPYRLSPWEEIHVNGKTVTSRKVYGAEARVIYPVGRYTTTLAAAELLHSLRAGCVRRVRLAALYHCSYALADYQQSLYAVRCRSDNGRNDTLSAWIKALQVSLPGKFAQQDRKWVDLPNAELPTEWGEYYWISPSNECVRYRSIAGHVQIEEVGGFSYGSVPAITVTVCAAGRSRLHQCLLAAGQHNTYYCDTDALIVSDDGRNALARAGLIRPGEWGYLQHVVTAEWCEIYGVKRYRIGGRIRCAGRISETGSSIQDDRSNQTLPPIGATIRSRQRPGGWRAKDKRHTAVTPLDDAHSQGGRVNPIRINRWDDEQQRPAETCPF